MDMKEWCLKNGVSQPIAPNISLDGIQKACMNPHAIDLVELEAVICQATAFNIYLKSLKGTLLAQIAQGENEMRRKMGLATELMGQDPKNKYLTRDEKEACILASRPELDKLDSELTVLRVRYSKIKDIPLAVDTAISNLKLVYTRKINEHNKQ